jgi:hypothetical protein
MIVSTDYAPQAHGSEWTQFPQADVFLVLQRACFLYEQTQTQEHCPSELLVGLAKTCDLLRNLSRTECPVMMAAEIVLIFISQGNDGPRPTPSRSIILRRLPKQGLARPAHESPQKRRLR